MGEQFLRIIAGFFVGVWVARYLGPEQFGLFSYVLAIAAIFGGIAKLGLDGIMVRELVNYPEKRDTYLGTAFWLKFFGALIVMGLIIAIAPFTNNKASTNTYVLIIVAGLLFKSFEVVEFHFQSQVLAKIVSICKVCQLALSSVIKIYLVLVEAELFWFVLVTGFDALTLATSYFIAYKINQNINFYKQFDLNIAKQLLKDSWPITISSLSIIVYMKIDQVMIKDMVGNNAVGQYAAAIKLTEAFLFIPMISVISLFPAILNAKIKSQKLYMERVQKLYDLHILIAIIIVISVYFSSEFVVTLIFATGYNQSPAILEILIFSNIVIFSGAVRGRWIIAENLQRYDVFIHLFGAVLNIILNFFFISKVGVLGAAYGTVLAYFLTLLITGLLIRKIRPALVMFITGFVNVLFLRFLRKGYLNA